MGRIRMVPLPLGYFGRHLGGPGSRRLRFRLPDRRRHSHDALLHRRSFRRPACGQVWAREEQLHFPRGHVHGRRSARRKPGRARMVDLRRARGVHVPAALASVTATGSAARPQVVHDGARHGPRPAPVGVGNARAADGVVGICRYNPTNSWGNTIAAVHRQLNQPRYCP